MELTAQLRRRGITYLKTEVDASSGYDWGMVISLRWVDDKSFVSGYPEARDIFISSQWALDERGVFLHKIERTLGVYVPLPDDVIVEWVAQPANQAKLDEQGPVEVDGEAR